MPAKGLFTKDSKISTSSDKEQVGIGENNNYSEEKGLKIVHKYSCQYLKSTMDKTNYYILKYASTKCIDHEGMLHTYI